MTNKNIVDMYNKGFSIDYIAKTFYQYKTKDDVPDHKFKNQYIITKKSITLEGAKKHVENIILQFAFSNKAN